MKVLKHKDETIKANMKLEEVTISSLTEQKYQEGGGLNKKKFQHKYKSIKAQIWNQCQL